MPKEKPTNLHKRLAMGDTVKGYARGGSIGMPVRNPLNNAATNRKGLPLSPITAAKRENGVRGMRCGGKPKR